jgi:hypothetical protein
MDALLLTGYTKTRADDPPDQRAQTQGEQGIWSQGCFYSLGRLFKTI